MLAWDAVKHGAADPADGQNLVVHEFAHQLDFADRTTDCAPALATRAEYLTWARVLRREFEALHEAEETGTESVLDIYGAMEFGGVFRGGDGGVLRTSAGVAREEPATLRSAPGILSPGPDRVLGRAEKSRQVSG